MTNKTKAHLALLGANIFYGAGFSIAKTVMPKLILPQAFILIRIAFACILFWVSFLFGKNFRTKIDKTDWGRIILCAILGVATNQLFFFKGLNLTSPIHASLIMLCTPILVTFIAAYFISEKINSQKIIGLIIAVLGAVLLITMRTVEKTASNVVLGDIYIFINACCYAFYLVLVKPLMQKYRPIIVIRWLFLIGFFFAMPFGFNALLKVQWHTFPNSAWYAIAFIVVCVTFFTYLWNIFALQFLNSSVAGAYIYLQPIFAAFISILFMGEELTWQKIVACFLIFIGVILVTRKINFIKI